MDFIGCTIAFHPRCRIDRLIGKTLNHCSVQYAPPQKHETQRQKQSLPVYEVIKHTYIPK